MKKQNQLISLSYIFLFLLVSCEISRPKLITIFAKSDEDKAITIVDKTEMAHIYNGNHSDSFAQADKLLMIEDFISLKKGVYDYHNFLVEWRANQVILYFTIADFHRPDHQLTDDSAFQLKKVSTSTYEKLKNEKSLREVIISKD
ncbi:MAG: hypothetical protein ACQESK_07555 [Bacteroidota bacterium]